MVEVTLNISPDEFRNRMNQFKKIKNLGFELDECDQLIAEGCRVKFYQYHGKWEVDITLTNGSVVSIELPLDKVTIEP